jgi:hypothetical protein
VYEYQQIQWWSIVSHKCDETSCILPSLRDWKRLSYSPNGKKQSCTNNICWQKLDPSMRAIWCVLYRNKKERFISYSFTTEVPVRCTVAVVTLSDSYGFLTVRPNLLGLSFDCLSSVSSHTSTRWRTPATGMRHARRWRLLNIIFFTMSYAAQAYSRVAASFHWMVAIPLIGCIGTVLKAQVSEGREIRSPNQEMMAQMIFWSNLTHANVSQCTYRTPQRQIRENGCIDTSPSDFWLVWS